MKHFKLSKFDEEEHEDYGANLYITCLDGMIKLMVKKGFETALLILSKVKNSFILPEAPFESIHLKVLKISSKAECMNAKEVHKVGS